MLQNWTTSSECSLPQWGGVLSHLLRDGNRETELESWFMTGEKAQWWPGNVDRGWMGEIKWEVERRGWQSEWPPVQSHQVNLTCCVKVVLSCSWKCRLTLTDLCMWHVHLATPKDKHSAKMDKRWCEFRYFMVLLKFMHCSQNSHIKGCSPPHECTNLENLDYLHKQVFNEVNHWFECSFKTSWFACCFVNSVHLMYQITWSHSWFCVFLL